MAETRFPGEIPPAPAHRRWSRRLGSIVLGVLALLGPWPVDNGTYRGAEYQARTLGRLGAMPGPTPPGPIRIGVAEVDLTPPAPVPLAGFSNQAGKPYSGIDTPCSARALTVASGSRAITILTADLLLVNSELARLVLDRAGLGPDEVVFTSSHTHGGPGSWGRHPLERLVAGKFDPAILRMLAERLGDVVVRSRANPVAAEMAMVQAHPAGRQKNRVVPGAATHDALSALIFRPAEAGTGTPPLAILAVFGAHATIVRTDPPRLSADYPGALASSLKAKTGAGMVLFAAGAVGDAAPVRPPIPSPAKAAQALGATLADDLLAVLPSARFSADVAVDRLRLAVDLPPVRLSFFSSWLRFSPAATWWIADRTTHLDAFRVGPAVLVGFPGDEAGHLAGRIVAEARRADLTPIVTSFNGDYRGYFESSAIYHGRSCYETRWMNFYGPELGEYLGDTAARMISHLSGSRPMPAPSSGRFAYEVTGRAIVAILLAGTAIAGRARSRSSIGSRPGPGWIAPAVSAGFGLAFAIAPRWIDWARIDVGDVLPLLFAGWIAPIALIRIGEGHPGDKTLFMAAIGFASSCWPIGLAMAFDGLVSTRPGRDTADVHQS